MSNELEVSYKGEGSAIPEIMEENVLAEVAKSLNPPASLRDRWLKGPVKMLAGIPAAIRAMSKEARVDDQLRNHPLIKELALLNGLSVAETIAMLREDIAESERRAAMPQRKATSAERAKLRNEMVRRLKENSPYWRRHPGLAKRVAFEQIRKATL